jgi:membrane associated rhomboid family serine protease
MPYHVDVPMPRVPYSNFGLIALTCLIHIGFLFSGHEIDPATASEPWVVWGGHIFLHGGLLHLFGNMLFLWVFGNAVCAKVGNIAYPFVYFGLGLVAGMTHDLVTGVPGIGASGAINGIVGMFVVWYVVNEVSCLYVFLYTGGTFSVSSVWIILLWFLFDIWGAVRGGGDVGYWAHIGGFVTGVALATVLLATGVVRMDNGETSIFDWLGGGRETKRRHSSHIQSEADKSHRVYRLRRR